MKNYTIEITDNEMKDFLSGIKKDNGFTGGTATDNAQTLCVLVCLLKDYVEKGIKLKKGAKYSVSVVNGNVAVTWTDAGNDKITYTKMFTPLNALLNKVGEDIKDAKFEFEFVNDQEGYMFATWTDTEDPTITVRYQFSPFKFMAKEINHFLEGELEEGKDELPF